MPTISSSVTFTVGNTTPSEPTTSDILFLSPTLPGELPGDPVSGHGGELRRLVYPGGALAPITYATNPDVYTNFSTSPLDKRPRLVTTGTLQANPMVGWLGYSRDVAIEERWVGTGTKSRMTLAFFLELQNYYQNPPTDGTYIQWEPRDRTTAVYNILIESLSLGGGGADQTYEFDYLAARHGYVVGVVSLKFRIVSEV